ncbi:Aldehyde dehydrogenase [Rhizophlyctis rosea]|uniref:Aldehyde dehydrogenase n=1 Tax=Rhizophlyctis rosea TaxID=64517 RepID=A0AAD5SJM4_9FUNG|nr:Aldehyde dehydrogenase [Rhizophlyctis rosea]
MPSHANSQHEAVELQYTELEAIPKIVNEARACFQTGRTKDLRWRTQQLRALHRMLDENEQILTDASFGDLKKDPGETFATDILIVKNEIIDLVENLDEWTAPEHVPTPIIYATDRCEWVPPLTMDGCEQMADGPCSAYQLTLTPVAAAIAAGNAVVIKLSEVSKHAAAAMTELLQKYMDPSAIKVINGAVAETTELLKQKFDIILYTGNGHVGKIVAQAAAKNLTPTILELGGKSPTIIAEDADLDISAKRILWGKAMNAGQTCIAPDYILLPRHLAAPFYRAIEKAFTKLLTSNPEKVSHLARIINPTHFRRLQTMLDSQLAVPGTKVVVGGQTNADDLFIAPTVISGVGKDDASMREEIFGPILPVVEVEDLDEAVEYVKAREHPLILYLYARSKKTIEKVLRETSSGMVLVNDVLIHATVPNLPFGGIGPSGMGKYHGKFGIEAFTHARSVMIRSFKFSEFLNAPRYPPAAYSARGMVLVRAGMEKKFKGPVGRLIKRIGWWLPWKTWGWVAVAVVAFLVGRRSQGSL